MKIFNLQDKKIIKRLARSGKITLAVYGLGKMGLPLACVFAQKGFKVIGVDINKNVVKKINQGENPIIGELGLDNLLKKGIKNKKIIATSKGGEAARKADVMIIIVPTFLQKNKKPDLEIVKMVAKTIGQGMQKGSLVILESTVPPKTTEGIIKRILEKESGFVAGKNFGLAFCPERTNSGTAIADIQGRINPKIVGGFERKSSLAAQTIYELINQRGVIPVSSCTVAEMIKISEMVYRDVKIAYANSLALICDELGIDAKEVIRGANTDAGCEILKPGPGVGGHCIPVYPYFIFDKVKRGTPLLKSARRVNDAMPKYTVKLIQEALGVAGKDIKKSNILILGIAYRGNVKEVRLSPGIEIYHLLKGLANRVFVFDPLFSPKEIENYSLNYQESFQNIDCMVITADHQEFKKLNWSIIAKQMRTKIIVDTKDLINYRQLKKLGFIIKRIGYAQ